MGLVQNLFVRRSPFLFLVLPCRSVVFAIMSLQNEDLECTFINDFFKYIIGMEACHGMDLTQPLSI